MMPPRFIALVVDVFILIAVIITAVALIVAFPDYSWPVFFSAAFFVSMFGWMTLAYASKWIGEARASKAAHAISGEKQQGSLVPRLDLRGAAQTEAPDSTAMLPDSPPNRTPTDSSQKRLWRQSTWPEGSAKPSNEVVSGDKTPQSDGVVSRGQQTQSGATYEARAPDSAAEKDLLAQARNLVTAASPKAANLAAASSGSPEASLQEVSRKDISPTVAPKHFRPISPFTTAKPKATGVLQEPPKEAKPETKSQTLDLEGQMDKVLDDVEGGQPDFVQESCSLARLNTEEIMDRVLCESSPKAVEELRDSTRHGVVAANRDGKLQNSVEADSAPQIQFISRQESASFEDMIMSPQNEVDPVRKAADDAEAQRRALEEQEALQRKTLQEQEAKNTTVRVAALLDAAQRSVDREALQRAIALAKAAGVAPPDVEAAERTLQDLTDRAARIAERRTAAAQELDAAKRSTDSERLQRAIEVAKGAGVEMLFVDAAEKALKALGREVQRNAATQELVVAQRAGDREALRQAIEVARGAGVLHDIVDTAEVTLKGLDDRETRKITAAEELDVASCSGDRYALDKAIQEAREAEVSPRALEAARSALKALDDEEGRRKTAAQNLDAAQHSGDREALRQAIEVARSAGVDEKTVAAADIVLAGLAAAIVRSSEELTAARETGDPERIKQALESATAAGVETDVLAAGHVALAAAEAKKKVVEAARVRLEAAVMSEFPKLAKFELRAALTAAKEVGVDAEAIAKGDAALARQMANLAAVAESTTKLEKAIESAAREPAQLFEALDSAKTLGGVAQDLLTRGEKAVARERHKADVRQELAVAAAARDLVKLRAALQAADAAGISDEAVLQEAREVTQAEEAKEAARLDLQRVMHNEPLDAEQLRSALMRANDVGIPDSDAIVSMARQILESLLARLEALANIQVAFDAAQGDRVDPKDAGSLEVARDNLVHAILACRSLGLGDATKEVAEAARVRRHLHNQLQDLKGATRVFCRVRPLNKRERDLADKVIVIPVGGMSIDVTAPEERKRLDNNQSNNVSNDVGETQRFEFDAAFGEDSTQEQIFGECRDLVQSVIDGYNITIFAYGQTGAGKTFTMMGAENPPELKGVCPRTVEAVFEAMEFHKMRYEFRLQAYMVEVYCSKVNDLIAHSRGIKDSDIKVLFQKNSVVMDGALMVEIEKVEDLLKVIHDGNEAKQIAATAMNPGSSRSHTILCITIHCTNRETGRRHQGKILLVDLAGCERLKKSQVEGDAKKEAIEINKSLTCLGDVISAVTLGRRVPYRNHILTKIMQDSLGGTAKTLMFVNVSPAESNASETVMALKFACRAKTITRQEAVATRIQASYRGHVDRKLTRDLSSALSATQKTLNPDDDD